MSYVVRPRLNYKFSLQDFFMSLKGVNKKSINDGCLCSFWGVDKIFYYNHARTAMRIALSSLGLKKDAKVGLMIINCLTVMNAVRDAGCIPIFLDVTEDFQLDMVDFDKKVNDMDAVIVYHMFGIPNRSILAIKEKYPYLPIIEDCAHSFLSTLDGKYTGTFGDIALFSFGRAKFPSIGDGGYMVINNAQYIADVEKASSSLLPVSKKMEYKNIITSVILSLLHTPFLYKNLSLRFLKKVDNKKDVVGNHSAVERSFYKSNLFLFLSKFKLIETFLRQQKENGIRISESLPASLRVKTIVGWNYFMYPILLANREEFIVKALKQGVEIGTHFSKAIQWAKEFGYYQSDCPKAESIAQTLVTLPCFYSYSSNKLELVLNSYFKK